jgi:glyoxylase-like metal-dependent hydrolase (beta-lactamase superfamily II)
LEEDTMRVERIVTGPFLVNTYIVTADGSSEAIVIDPGDGAEEILAVLMRAGLAAAHIFNTHGHADHMTANAAVKRMFPEARIHIHGRDAHMLADPVANLSAAFGYEAVSPAADRFFEGNTEITAAGITWRIEHLPGHSPGSVCLMPKTEPPVIFAGDTLFAGTIGRTDFPGGDPEMLVAGIRDKILSLPEETTVYPGHGDPTTVAVEKRTNYFVMDELP